MDRPRTGRRRVRSGAVRATEIIDRAARRFPRPATPPRAAGKRDDPADAPTALLPVLDGSARGDAQSSRGRRAAKLTGLALAALTLCATVATAAIVSREHRGDALPAGRSSPITGQRALLPDDLTAAVSAAPTATRRTPAPSTAASTAIVGHTTSAPGDDGTHPAAEAPEPPPSTVGMTDDELVAEYYRLVRSNPGNAFALLSGTEFGADLGDFVTAWAGVTDVRVSDITATADGVVVDVRLLLATGQTLWVRQLFDVTETTPRRIANVTLLSAQIG